MTTLHRLTDEQTNGLDMPDDRDNGPNERWRPPEHWTDAQQAQHRNHLLYLLSSVEADLEYVASAALRDRDLPTDAKQWISAMCDIVGDAVQSGIDLLE